MNSLSRPLRLSCSPLRNKPLANEFSKSCMVTQRLVKAYLKGWQETSTEWAKAIYQA